MPIHLPPGLMVSVSGVRGRVGDPLTPELMAGIAAALGAHLREIEGGDTVCLGRDSRVSGPMFARAVMAGLQSVGCNVIDLGVEAVVTGHIGPKAFRALQAAGVQVYVGATGSVREAAGALAAGQLQGADKPSVEGHWV